VGEDSALFILVEREYPARTQAKWRRSVCRTTGEMMPSNGCIKRQFRLQDRPVMVITVPFQAAMVFIALTACAGGI